MVQRAEAAMVLLVWCGFREESGVLRGCDHGLVGMGEMDRDIERIYAVLTADMSVYLLLIAALGKPASREGSDGPLVA